MFMRENGIHIEFQSHEAVSSYQDQNNKIQLKVKTSGLLKNSSLFDKIKA